MPTRRHFLAVAALALPAFAQKSSGQWSALPEALAQLERKNRARLGVAVLDTATGERSGYRADERFAMCSTFKFLLASAVLQRVDHGQEKLDHALAIPLKPLLGNSPLTEPHAGGTMSVSALCEAVLTRSDNTAANV